jgi:hypothetical protein
MNIYRNEPPREYTVGFGPKVTIRDCAHICLDADEQITLKTENESEYDVTRKNWGFYATPSINGRLARFNLRTALVKNRLNQFFVLLVEQGSEANFNLYVHNEGLTMCGWLDDKTLPTVERALVSAQSD